jgi:KipI family sensor histidine kinase inhibitor
MTAAIHTPGRRVAVMGEAAGLVFTAGIDEAQQLAAAVLASAWPGVEDVVPAEESVGILVDPEAASVAEVLALAACLPIANTTGKPRHHDIDVCFDGPDLSAVAVSAGMAVEDVIASLESAALRVGWLGFMPGFPYLSGLPTQLVSVPRLDRPRVQVPAGAFAIANGYAGIYPEASPGGWNVLGRTGLSMFDPERPSPATLAPGDLVRVRAVESVVSPERRERAPITAGGARRITVLEAGAMTLVQDRGRHGVAHLGVPRAGPADGLRHAVANIAVGNADGCAAVEMTAAGMTVVFGCDAFVALVGDCEMRIDGRPTPPSTTQPVEQGQTVAIGAVRSGLRAYLGIGGGLAVPRRLGSRSSDAVTGIWPGPLQRGDEIDLGMPGRARGRWFAPASERPAVIRLSRGPDGADGAGDLAFGALLRSEWEVAGESNRVGTRLQALGQGARPVGSVATVPSRATVMGAVQLPPDGCPVVLGPDHGTVGGYPVVAVVAGSSLSAAGQLRPGDLVRFEESKADGQLSVGSVARRSVSGWMAGASGA